MISRLTQFIPILALAFALCCPGPAPAATIDYYAGGFHSQSSAYVENSLDPKETQDSGTQVAQGANDVSTDPSAEVSAVSVSADNYGYHDTYDEKHRLVYLQSHVSGYSDDLGGRIAAYGNANTVAPMVTNGVFFIISPSDGEALGSPVMLSWSWSAYAETTTGGRAALTGGYTDNMAITLNDYPAPGGPTPDKTLWSYPKQELASEGFFHDESEGTFQAVIGDIIGVHLGAYASLDFTGLEDSLEATSFQMLELNVESLPVPIPGAVWLLGAGLIGLAGWRRKLKR